MKTTFLKIASLLLMMAGANDSFASNTGNSPVYTDLTWIKKFDRIEVHGNVQLHLISGDKNRVEMNDSYFDHNALVQEENGVLRITCYRQQRLNVWVTVNNLRSLDAYDNVLVRSEGKFSAFELGIALHNHAKADLDLDCVSASVRLNDNSMADISGDALEGDLISNYAATLNAANFKAENESQERVDPVWETSTAFVTNAANDPLNTIPDGDIQTTDVGKEIRFTTASKKPVYLDTPKEVQSLIITHTIIN